MSDLGTRRMRQQRIVDGLWQSGRKDLSHGKVLEDAEKKLDRRVGDEGE